MDLTDVKIAIIVTDYFEETELTEPRKALEEAGAEVTVIAPLESDIQGVNGHEDGQMLPVDITLEDADPSDYDALLIPGGVGNADALRTNEKAQAFARAMDSDDKPIGVLCHGSWLLIEAGLVDGRSMTSFHSIATDLRNAGAEWRPRRQIEIARHVDLDSVAFANRDGGQPVEKPIHHLRAGLCGGIGGVAANDDGSVSVALT